jgi:DNA replication protein DnaC
MTAPTANRTYQQLRSHLAYLKLDAAAEALAPVLDEGKDASQVEVLERLLGLEVAATATRRRESRRRLAGLPADWRLADFDTDAQPSVTPELLRDLAELRFIDTGGNVLFIGPPGVGTKTVLAIGLGHAAIDAGHRAYYTTAADLVARCHKAAIEGRWANTMRFFAPPQLLIIDELGYLPLTGEAASSLFQVINRRYAATGGSVVLTTNRGISQWGEIFDDPVVAAAMLDGSCTAPSSSPSTARATACATTATTAAPTEGDHAAWLTCLRRPGPT